MMKAIMVDDELLALELLEKQVEAVDGIEVVGKYTRPGPSLEILKKEKVHVAFLDIQMPEMNGLDLADKMLEINPQLLIVFITAYNKYAVEAFELSAIDYLIKPIRATRLNKTIERLKKELKLMKVMALEQKPETLRIQTKGYLSFEVEKDNFKPITWRTSKAQELFIYLLGNEGSFVEKDLLAEMLWENKDLDSGISLLYTTVYNIRKALRPYTEHFKIHNRTDGYLLELTNVDVDVTTWLKEIKAITCNDTLSTEKCETLLFEYDGTYLAQHDYIWLERTRQYIAKVWLDKANQVVAYYVAQDEIESAIRMLQRMIDLLPTEEKNYLDTMKLYERLGNIDVVKDYYYKLTEVLHTELGVKPNPEINEWYQKNIIRKLTINDMMGEVNVTDK